MGTRTPLRARLEPSLVARLAAGDVLALTAFFTMGAHTHGLRPFSNPTVVLEGATPFLLTWGLAAVVAGLYTADAVGSVARAVTVTVPAWILAALAGQGLRGTEFFRGSVAWTFLVVTLVVGGGLVVGWRVLATILYGDSQ